MNKEDYEIYHQKGGTYVLPIEMFQELWGEMENWKHDCKKKDNIINELEKWLMEWRNTIDYPDFYEEGIIDCIDEIFKKLQELKINKNN